jgi:hypothetical protein
VDGVAAAGGSGRRGESLASGAAGASGRGSGGVPYGQTARGAGGGGALYFAQAPPPHVERCVLLNSEFCALHPKLLTLNPRGQSLNLKPKTLSPAS